MNSRELLEKFKAYLFQYMMDSLNNETDEEGMFETLHEVNAAYNLFSNFIEEDARCEVQNEC